MRKYTDNLDHITEIIPRRFSCRQYLEMPINERLLRQLQMFMAGHSSGPFGSVARFQLVATTEDDRSALRGLGTYSFIRGAPAFIVGAVRPAAKDLEDFGYLTEQIILFATALGLGTCWLGGTFTRSGFSQRINLMQGEIIPAVVAIGVIANPVKARSGLVRQFAGGHQRRPWGQLFSAQGFDKPLALEEAGTYATPLEMVRLGPSASNKQPWRIIKDGNAWHFYLCRTEGYREGFFQRLLAVADLQRVDMGIALCHFELTARDLGLHGEWVVAEPGIVKPDALTEYTASWVEGK
ncbi:MAG: nitroreductase family protein [Anaerolineales bacterium]|nr:nitroreductase family protein [Anaerolineales bacterium]